MNPRSLSLAITLVVGAALCSPARSQCSTSWSSAAPEAQLSGSGICSTLWDPDGGGPLPQRLVVGGGALVGGASTPGQLVMTWDGSQWQSLGNGPGTAGAVTALTTWNGLLVAAGTFTGGGTDRIALWNGSAWQPLGPGLAGTPVAITEWNGNLVAIANTPFPVISVWNGTAWSTLPAPPTSTLLLTVVPFQGLLCVAGNGATSNSGALERWNGTTWQPTISANAAIRTLGVRSLGFITSLYAGGSFTSIGGVAASYIASTSGGTAFGWAAVGNGLQGPAACIELHVRATSALGTALVMRILNGFSPQVVQLVGSSFVAIGNLQLNSLSFYGGSYHGATGGSVACRRYDGTNWVPVLGQSIDGEVRALTKSGSDMIVGGTIQSTAGAPLNRIARWNGTTFQSLGTGMTGASVDALLTLDNGDAVAGGEFTMAGGLIAGNIARWNGTAWLPLGTGCNQRVFALCRMPNGDVIAGGRFTTAGGVLCVGIARWNGTAWSPLGSGMNGDVLALALRSDGTLFAGGAFTIAGVVPCNHIAQWNGSAWSPVGTGMNDDVHGLAVRPNDEVVAVGAFTNAGGLLADRCARWTGSAWAPMGASSGDPNAVRSVFALPNGDVVAGRGFHQPTVNPDSGISRWSGSAWSGFGSGLAALTSSMPASALAMAQRADGALIVGGDFAIAGGLVAHGLATLSSTCPASASSYGAGCSTAAGPLAITADTLPWIGATFRTTTTGIAANSLCFGVIGFTQLSVPLATLLPQGQPGCMLLASADIAMLLVPGPGTAQSALALANNPSLLGGMFFEQTIPLELDAFGALVAVRGSNALMATIGTL